MGKDNKLHKNALKSLKESEAKYRTIFENTGTAFMIIEDDMTISLINGEVEKTFGYLKEEVEGKKKWTEFVANDEDLKKMMEYHRLRRENPETAPPKYEFQAISKERKIKDVLVAVSIIPGTKKSIASFLDITDIKKTENALRESEVSQSKIVKALKKSKEELKEAHENLEHKVQERTQELKKSNEQLKKEIEERKKAEEKIIRLANIVESSDDAIASLTLDGIVTSWNKGAEKVYGYSAEEIIGKGPHIMLNPSEWEKVSENIEKIKKGEKTLYYEAKRHRKDGKEIYVSVKLSPIKNSKGNIKGVSLISRDITDKKTIEKDLRESEKRYRSLYENNPSMYFTLDSEMIILSVNRFGAGQLGYSVQELIGKSMLSIFYEEDKKSALKNMEHALEKWGNVFQWEQRKVRKNGSILWVRESTRAIKRSDGKIFILIVCEDITDRKKAEEELYKTIKELERSNYELQQFAYITSHDLQEPLRTIASFTQLLERRYKNKLDKDADEFIDFVVDAAVRMKEMIQGLLNYSHIGSNYGELRLIDADKSLKDAISNLKNAIEENNAVITHDPLPTVAADKRLITQLFQNLIGNAIKFRKKDVPPRIHISASLDEENNEYVFKVADNGIGMEEEYTDKIFDVFKRLHTMDEYRGTGIGLAISKKIVERHGGHIWVESTLGEGSTFYFTIPIHELSNEMLES